MNHCPPCPFFSEGSHRLWEKKIRPINQNISLTVSLTQFLALLPHHCLAQIGTQLRGTGWNSQNIQVDMVLVASGLAQRFSSYTVIVTHSLLED